MGTRLRNLKKSLKKTQLADGKPTGGKGRLTDAEINKMQAYYGNAIRANKGDLEKMREAVWAVYFHKASSDKEPAHNFCLEEWCPYTKAQKAGTLDKYKHSNNLPEAVMTQIKPILKDLAKTQLLRKSLQGYTQNVNERKKNLMWKFSLSPPPPKKKWSQYSE